MASEVVLDEWQGRQHLHLILLVMFRFALDLNFQLLTFSLLKYMALKFKRPLTVSFFKVPQDHFYEGRSNQ